VRNVFPIRLLKSFETSVLRSGNDSRETIFTPSLSTETVELAGKTNGLTAEAVGSLAASMLKTMAPVPAAA
jgi:hypothetical protein